jgi:hypothetical protein
LGSLIRLKFIELVDRDNDTLIMDDDFFEVLAILVDNFGEAELAFCELNRCI